MDCDDDDSGFLHVEQLAEGLAGEAGLGGDGNLLHGDLWTNIASGEVHQLHYVRLEQCVGELASGHGVGRKDCVGACAAQLFPGPFFRDAGDNGQLGIQGFRREDDEEIFGIGGQGGNESFRPENPGFEKAFILGGVGGDGEHACLDGIGNTLLTAVDDQEGRVCPLKFIGGVAAYASETADDEVVMQIVDHSFCPVFAVAVLQFKFDDSLGHGTNCDEHRADSEDNQKGVEDASGMAERPYLLIADGGDGGERHIEGFEPGIVFDEHKADSANKQREAQESDGEKDAADETGVHETISQKCGLLFELRAARVGAGRDEVIIGGV